MKLSDNEKRDVIKYLEAGKPLPEKYRFLLFDDDREVELLWNGKTNEVTNVVLPFQVIEQIDEPRGEGKIGVQNTLFDMSGRQITGWTNKLIWGDNKLILSSLKNGPLQKEIEAQGGLKLIYIDPPFDVGADFSMDITIGDGEDEQSFTKKPSVIEEIAYRDTWGKGADSFIAMIYERLKLMHDLLAEDGSIYVHCDYRVNSYMRLVLDEVFRQDNFISEIVWKRTGARASSKFINPVHDLIYFYAKDIEKVRWNSYNTPYSQEYIEKYYTHAENDGRRFQDNSLIAPGKGYQFEWKGVVKRWRHNKEKLEQLDKENRLFYTGEGVARYKRYLDEMEGIPPQDIWSDISNVNSQGIERLDYPTQKPEEIIDRIIKASSNEDDLIADVFCGSGTTLAVAEKLNRKWIGSDLGRFGIHTSRKRLIGVQRELKKAGKDFRAFEILNVGRYERENFLAVNDDLRAEEKNKQAEQKEKEFIKLILAAYMAEPVDSFKIFVGKKRDRLVAIGPINAPVSEKFVEQIIEECREKEITKVDVLGFDWEMGFDRHEFKNSGIDIAFRIIPREVFDRKAVEKGQVKFYDIAYIECSPIMKGKGNLKELSIELKDFSVFYNQDDSGEISEALKPGGTKVVIENGQVVKISKDKNTGLIEKEVLTKKWSDWVDYWAVDFNFSSRKEIIKVIEDGQEKEVWTGDYIFDNEWQSFRTKRDRNLELASAVKEMPKGMHKVAVKVVDIFGNDTTKVIEVKI